MNEPLRLQVLIVLEIRLTLGKREFIFGFARLEGSGTVASKSDLWMRGTESSNGKTDISVRRDLMETRQLDDAEAGNRKVKARRGCGLEVGDQSAEVEGLLGELEETC